MKIACTIVALGAAFLASGLIVGNEAEAQFCALRQPTLAFQEAFEEGTAMRSFDREVTEEHREIIAEVLPFTLNRRELGTHTLYAGMSEREEVRGYLHVRSERDKWGLTELAWEIGPDLTIQGLTVQRTRSAGKDYLESSRFLSLVKGKGLREIRTLLSDDGGELTETVRTEVGSTHETHARLGLRSALKTLLATALIWEDVLAAHGYAVPQSALELPSAGR